VENPFSNVEKSISLLLNRNNGYNLSFLNILIVFVLKTGYLGVVDRLKEKALDQVEEGRR
jgi:hypothetical protein